MTHAVHVELDTQLEGLRVTRELRSGDWELHGWGLRVVVREWSWAERRRLLEACSGTRSRAGVHHGLLARDHFIAGLLSLTCEPVPPPALWPLYAHLVLRLFGVDGERRLTPLAAAERRLALEFGWEPGRLAGQRAGDLDRLLDSLEPDPVGPVGPVAGAAGARAVGPEPGWRRIVVDDGRP